MVSDGKLGTAFDGVYDPTFSPDSRHLAYRAFRRGKPRDGQRVVLDGVESKIYAEVGAPTFSADGAHFAYLASDDRKWFAVVDGMETTPIDALVASPENPTPRLIFDSPTRCHFLAIRTGEVVRVSITIATDK